MQILVTDPIDDTGLDRLRDAGHTVTTAYDLTHPELIDTVPGYHALIVRSGTEVTQPVFDAGTDLVIVGRAGIGVDNIDIDAATDHGVIVANAPDGNVRAAAEHTVAMTFAAARSIPQAHTRLKQGEWAKDAYLGTELNGRTAAIVGLGRVGEAVADRLDAIGMTTIAYDPYIGAERADRLGIELHDLDTCLERADVLTIHTPLTPDTEHLIAADELETMGGGYVINCARGGIIDEPALADAVDTDVIDGAAVDVFATEPVTPDNPLLDVDDIVVTPHLGASTAAAQQTVAESIADQVIAALANDPVVNALNAPSIEASAVTHIRPYIDIAETAGKIAVQLFDDRIATITVRYEGDIADEDVDFVTASAITGVFSPLERQVNPVNALQLADDRGIDVVEETTHQSSDFQNLITVTVGDGTDAVSVCGTLFADDDPRIVRIDGYRVDAIPAGHMLIATNRDEPGVIGYIGTVLGDHDINIAGMFNARHTIGGEALTVYNLDDPIPEAVLETLLGDDRIISVDHIVLDDADMPLPDTPHD